MQKYVYLLLLSVVSFTACITNRSVPARIFTAESYCKIAPVTSTVYDSLINIRISRDTVVSPEAIKRFSRNSVSVAADMGILSLLTGFTHLEEQIKQQPDARHRLEMVVVRQEIADRIGLASAEVKSVLSEIDCELGRANELKNYLQAQIDKREISLTIYSIIAGTIGTVAGGVLSLSGADDVYAETAEITGAAVSAYLAIRPLIKKDIKVEFIHKRNHLADVRDNPPQSNLYPPMVWHYLTKENEVTEQTPIIRKTILNRWRELNLLTDADDEEQKERMALLFGQGGMYSIDDIEKRLSLIDLLETEISMMNQELKQLQQELLLGYHPVNKGK